MATANFDLHIHNNELHAAGLSSGFAGISHMVMKLDQGNWTNAGNDLNDTIRTIESYEGSLFIGGDFTADFGSTITLSHAAVLDTTGVWVEAFGGLNAPVYDLQNVFGSLYAGGPIGDAGDPLYGLALRYPSDTAWYNLLNYTIQHFLPFNGERLIRRLEMVGSQLFAAGSFDLQPLVGTVGQNVAWIDPGSGWVVPLAIMDGPVFSLQEGQNTSLYAGGSFSIMTGQSVPNIGWTDVSVMSVAENTGLDIRIWPTPSNGVVNFRMDAELVGLTAQIFDMSGRLVESLRINGAVDSFDLTGLKNGSYRLMIPGTSWTEMIVISK